MNSLIPLARLFASLAIILIVTVTATTKPSHVARKHNAALVAVPNGVTVNLADFGAAGNGVADDGPAFQSALDALAAAGGGTLLVPAGTYLVATPVVKNFSGIEGATLIIQGVPSDTMPAPPTASGQELSAGLNLTSRVIPATGASLSAFTLTNLRGLTIEHMDFTGQPQMFTDAFITLLMVDITKATIRHCEFYGLSSFGLIPEWGGGNMIRAINSELSIEASVFLGCTANSGAYAAVVSNLNWRKFTISNSIFLDYGQRPFFGKTGLGAPLSWLDIGNPAFPTPESPRREFVVRDTFLDEGNWMGITAFPRRWGPPSPIDLVYISGLKMNVSNLGTAGHGFYDIDNLLIENSHYGWSRNAVAAVDINRVGNAIYDKLTCIDHADRLRADPATGRLTVINSIYGGIDSLAQTTTVLNTAPGDDPVQYVRQQFVSALGRPPDPAAHFYWSDLLLRCGEDTACRDQQRAALADYLSSNPQADFSFLGTVTDEFGEPLSDARVTLTGSQSVSVLTNAQGSFQFSNLPTSGSYTVAISKPHYTFAGSSQTFLRPARNVSINFQGQLNRHTIQGRIARANGAGVNGLTVQLAESPATQVVTDGNGNYSFSELPEGGTFTVVPSSTDFAFTPASRIFTNLSADQTADFVGQQINFLLTGTVEDEAGNPISGATVSLTGSQSASKLTDLQGSFSFVDLPTAGTYSVTVSKPHYSFLTTSYTLSNPIEDMSIEFTASRNRHLIHGRIVKHDGTAISGVTVQLTPSATTSATTDATGYYSFPGLAAGETYTVTPVLTNFVFTPGTRTFANLGADQTADFSGQLQNISLVGRVSDANSNSLSGADISLTGSQSATAVTDSAGNFQFSNLPTSGTYTVSVSKLHYSFTTSSQTFVRPTDNVTANFTGTLNRHAITGRITRANGNGVGGVTVQLAQSPATSVVTDANGYYAFTALAAGEDYAVVPSSSDFAFTPANVTFDDLARDGTASFVGQLKPRIMTIGGSDTAVALDSMSFMAEPFSVFSSLGFSSDGLTRLMIFARDFETTDISQISLFAEDDAGGSYPLTIEHMHDVANHGWLKQLNFKLSPNLPSGSCVRLRLSVAGVSSNNARICLSPR